MKKCIKHEVFNEPEPDLKGSEPSGLNLKWILWYCNKHNCSYGQAVEAGLNRLDRANKKRRFWKWPFGS